MKQDIFLAKVKIKIVFVVPTKKAEYLGVQLLSAYLKRKGFFNIKAESYNSPLVMELARQESRVIFAFCLFTPFVKEFLDLCRKIKEVNKNSVCIFGGPHPLFKPEIIQSPGVDAICLGEGEEALAEFVEKYYQCGQLPLDVDNFWVKDKQGRVHKNKLRPLVNLDNLPAVDRKLFPGSYFFRKGLRRFSLSRGCIFDCAYCTVAGYAKFYGIKPSEYYRLRSIEGSIGEIKEVLTNYGGSVVGFRDSIFGLDLNWLKEFCYRYKKEINLPFYCNSQANVISRKHIEYLDKAGCYLIQLGLETANQKKRIQMLNKCFSNQEFIEKAKLIKKANIRLGTYNIIGLPEGSLEEDLNTLKMNQKLRTNLVECKIFSFYPGMQLYGDYKKKGLTPEKYSVFHNIYWTVINDIQARRDLKKLLRLHCLFNFFVYFNFPRPLIKFLISLPLGFFYKIFALAVVRINLHYRKMIKPQSK
jgi:radical SAM superfamily enzyme YgiQ (UPF0313 family)